MEGKGEGKKKVDEETKEEVSRERKGEDQTVVVKRRCITPVSTQAFSHFQPGGGFGELWEFLG